MTINGGVSVHFLFAGRCVSAEPAAVFDVLLVLLLRKVFDAAEAAFFDVTFGGDFV